MDRINDKMVEIEKFLKELESTLPKDLYEYLNNFKIKAICERYFEKIIEAVVDLSFLIINEKGFETPKDDENSFEILSNHNLISKELSIKLKAAKGMRNIIAHEYGKIDDLVVFDAVTQELTKDVRELISKIEENLKTSSI